MRTSKFTFSENKYKQWVKEGRGTGAGEEYKPWLTVRDVPSIGRLWKLVGIKMDRVCHLLSDLEAHCFMVNEFSPTVTDINEQFPLPLEKTLKIAEELKIRHPVDPVSRFTIVMTTDLLVHEGQRRLARTCKYEADIIPKFNSKGQDVNQNTRNKLKIEMTYWQREGVEWAILTEKTYPRSKINNIRNFRGDYIRPNVPLPNGLDIESVMNVLQDKIKGNVIPRFVTTKVDQTLGLHPGVALRILRHMIAIQMVPVDLCKLISFNHPLYIK